MNWKGLRYFLHVARVGNISTAAADLGIVQPALSRHIARLEQELGAPLLVRLPRGVQLTEAGRLFAERGRRMMAEYDLAREELAAIREGPAGHVALGVLSTLARTLVPRVVTRLRERNPGLSLHIVEGSTHSLQEAVLAGRVQVALLSETGTVARLDATPLVPEVLAVFGPAQDAGTRDAWTLRELSETPLVVSAGMRAMVDAQIRSRGRRLTVDVEVDSVEAVRGLLLRGKGVALLPVTALREDAEQGRIAAWQVADANLHRMLAVAHGTGDLSLAVREVVRVVRTEVFALAAEEMFTSLPRAIARA